VSQPPIKNNSGRARLDFELVACADCEEASVSAHAILVGMVCREKPQLGRYTGSVAPLLAAASLARSSAGHILLLRFKAQLIKPTWL